MKNITSNTIGVVVVIYNRADLLIRCLDAVVAQTLLPTEIFIIDNHSDDKTRMMLKEANYIKGDFIDSNEHGKVETLMYKHSKSPVKVTYVFKDTNDGGAGGFYAGMKMAHEAGLDWIWMMDDDGVPAVNALYTLLNVATKRDLLYVNPLVINECNHTELSFGLAGKTDAAYFHDKEIFINAINPFNGTFINHKVIDKIGYIKREMFIWGDETEYTNRVSHSGFKIATICHAYHYHPKRGLKSYNIIPFVNWKKCYFHNSIHVRNYAYINKKYNKSEILKDLIRYTIAYGLRFRFRDLLDVYRYTYRGLMEIWES